MSELQPDGWLNVERHWPLAYPAGFSGSSQRETSRIANPTLTLNAIDFDAGYADNTPVHEMCSNDRLHNDFKLDRAILATVSNKILNAVRSFVILIYMQEPIDLDKGHSDGQIPLIACGGPKI